MLDPHSIEYFDALINDKAQKSAGFGLQGTLNARKLNKQFPYNRF